MAIQLIRKVRDRQPIDHAKVAWSNNITRGLRFLSYGKHLENVASGRPMDTARLSGSISLVTNKYGIGINVLGGSTRKSINTNAFGNGDCTAMFVGSPVASTSAEYAVSQAGSFEISFGVNFNENFTSVSGRLCLGILQPSYRSSVYVDGVLDGTPSCYLIGKSTGSGFAYKNGLPLTASTTGTLPACNGLATDTVSVAGKLSDGSFAWETPLNLVAIWNRRLSESEAASVTANPWQLFEPETIPLFYSTVTAQYARPTSDVSSGTWTASSGSDLFAMLDETTVSDADYIVTTGTSTCEVALGSLSDPASSSGHVVRYRISADAGGITVRLRQGTTTIATWTHATAPTSLTTYAQTLTSGEADSITDYTALRLQFEAT